ncbi:hypothetical protein KKF34_06925 [Myxococcota bacterium]|nr:hypothetical protein [Myxococcota bacterium]MBU1381439.1 hypothetical protein [Myxococcota bacterium]MBU1496594.1 hypothetical protein [Myxococcota bacterium]
MAGFAVLVFLISEVFTPAQGTSAPSARDEIMAVSSIWEVSETKGTIQYSLRLALNSSDSGNIGTLKGTATITTKGKKYTITVDTKLLNGKYSYVTKYPALKATFKGTKTSSDPKGFPLKPEISFTDTLIMRNNKLCPKSQREFVKCMNPVKK